MTILRIIRNSAARNSERLRKIVEYLRSREFDVEYPFNNMGTAFRATYGKNNHNRKIALLAEYDALPEIGHACGHSAICSISILAALALKKLQDQLDADIHIIGTPAEETYGGKCIMVEDGVFDQYDFAILVHPNHFSAPGANLLALDSAIYDFYGKASHGAAAPWEGINALNAARLLFDSVDMFRQHVGDPMCGFMALSITAVLQPTSSLITLKFPCILALLTGII